MDTEEREIQQPDTIKEEVKDLNSLPVRAYLDETVVLVLMEGMAELSKVRPENPVEWLGEYLLEHSQE